MKRILVISNACFSNTDSNGRTISKLLSGYEKGNLAQFFVYGTPDFNVCDKYYQVSDKDALNSFVKCKPYGKKVTKADIINKGNDLLLDKNKGNNKKTPLKMILREIAWRFGRWKSKELYNWIFQFNPDIIFINLGDNAFLPDFATGISKKIGIPIVVYSTENYYFKDFNYITKKPSLFYYIFNKIVKSSYKRMEKHVVKGVFNTPLLTDLYASEFDYPCQCVFSKSSIDFKENYKCPEIENIKISYLGNLGVGRHKSLIEIANVLTEISPDLHLDIYGKIPNNEIEVEFNRCVGINYKGFVSYEEVVQVMHNSTLLIHTEINDEFYNKDLKYAFSTKIADSICSGTPLFLYANKELAETDFLLKENCAFTVTEIKELKNALNTAIFNEEKRKNMISNAYKTAKTYFKKKEELFNILEGD